MRATKSPRLHPFLELEYHGRRRTGLEKMPPSRSKAAFTFTVGVLAATLLLIALIVHCILPCSAVDLAFKSIAVNKN